MTSGPLRSVVLADKNFVIDVVHDEVEVAIKIQIAKGGAVGEAGLVEAPGGRPVGEGEVAPVLENVVRDLLRRHPGQQVRPLLVRKVAPARVGVDVRERGLHVIDEVGVAGVFAEPVRDEEVGPAVAIEVGEKGRPAPVGARDIRELGDVAEDGDFFFIRTSVGENTPVQVERVEHVLVVVPLLHEAPERPRIHPAHVRLLAAVVLGGHVQHNHIEEAVAVDVRHVVPHREVREVPRRLLDDLAEGAVAVVQV